MSNTNKNKETIYVNDAIEVFNTVVDILFKTCVMNYKRKRKNITTIDTTVDLAIEKFSTMKCVTCGEYESLDFQHLRPEITEYITNAIKSEDYNKYIDDNHFKIKESDMVCKNCKQLLKFNDDDNTVTINHSTELKYLEVNTDEEGYKYIRVYLP